MDRPLHHALPVALLATVVVLLRSIIAFDPVRTTFDLRSLSVLSRGLWMVVALLAFPTVGAWVDGRSPDARPIDVLAVAGIAAFLGALAGTVLVRFGLDVSGLGGFPTVAATTVVFAALDAALFGLLVVAGTAIADGGRRP